METTYLNNRHRLSQRKKDANDKQWYKDQANLLDNYSFANDHFIGFGGVSEYKRKKVNYDLFNNIINKQDFQYVCKPFGAETGDLPANFTNRDIVSGKLKVLMGMEMKMPFAWKVVAVNEEATTRKEQKESEMLRDFVTAEIMRPLRQSIEEQLLAQNKGQKLTPEEQQQLQQQIEEETQAKTPDEVRKYMTREHQDPAEMMIHQILEYLIQKEKVSEKFNKGWKHSLISGEEIYWVGVLNGEPSLKVVNPLFFDYDKSPDLDYIEDGEWAVSEMRLTPSEVIANFGSELTEDELDRIYEFNNDPSHIYNSDFTFNPDNKDEPYTVRVLHTVWKSLKKIQFLDYLDENGEIQSKIVDENYKLNKDAGDVSIETEWIPECHECYKILSDIFVHCRPVLGQHKDLDNLWSCKLPYIGAACDALNSPTTSPMDRMKAYQYFYNVLVYRVELLMASDKGKILAANINAIPKSAGINISKWQYFIEANKIAWFNPNEEGNKGGSPDVTNMVKEIDMSLAGNINQYIELAEYIEKKCGSSIGVTPQMEAQAGNEPVSNNRQNLIQASHIIQPYFELHNNIKGNVLDRLTEAAKVAYSGSKARKLTYVLDDMSIKMLTTDPELLDNSTYGLFISNSSKAHDAKQAVEQLAQAALQNQQADLGDIIKVIRSESVTEAEELLEAARQRKVQEEQAMEKQKLQAQQQQENILGAREERKYAHEEKMVVLKEEERRKTEIEKAALMGASFNPDLDKDDDGENDFVEIARDGLDAQIKGRQEDRKDQEFQHKVENDKQKLKLEAKKLQAQKNKPVSKSP